MVRDSRAPLAGGKYSAGHDYGHSPGNTGNNQPIAKKPIQGSAFLLSGLIRTEA
jgi:hypothetical protein